MRKANDKNGRSYKTYLVTSCKGGIGKSTVTANIAMAIAVDGKRVMIVDCDFSNRSLDLILGCEDDVVYDICDLVTERTTPHKAVITDRREERLTFIAAPLVKRDKFTPEQFCAAIDKAAREFSCDYVFIDTPGASDDTLSLTAPAADGALVVASHQPTSVRGAEKTGYLLEELGVKEQYLVINRYDSEEVLRGNRPGLNSLIDRTHIPLLGVIPNSQRLELAQETGVLALELKRDEAMSARAFEEIARRLCGDRIPVMSYLPEKKRRRLLTT